MDDPASLSFFLLAEAAADGATFSAVSVLLNILLVLVLVLCNGFFVATEFAFVAVRKSRIESLAAEGSRAAKRLLECINNLNAYISATQLGITLFSLGLGWIGEPAVAMFIEPLLVWIGQITGATFLASGAVLHTISFVIAFSIITFLHIVLGELAPKTMALELSERVALAVALPMQIFYKTFYYPIRMLDWTGAKTVRLFGLHPTGEEGSVYSEEEIRHLIDVSKKSGHLNEEEQKLIHQVFEFSETTVREAMVPRTEIFAIPVTYDLNEIAEAFKESGFSRFPVYRESLDDMAGVIHSKDVMSYLLNPDSFRIEKILRRPKYVVDTARLEDVLRKMQAEKFHFGFVVDEHGGIEGIITLEDLLEEIVGEIADEYDEEVAEQIHEQKDGSYILDGGLAVRDLNRQLGLNVPMSEGYTTIAGFLMAEAGQLLAEGERVRFNGHEFVVEEVEKRRILRVKMEKVAV
ncbi:MAG: HlyC/CorC family transporter [Acidobacteria bacterium]|nr:MAG: HlyC/CorC family transporter [Acidobacteriota bacterium]REK04072.1 MAG: HlyC/CorC family transporter [Acidobacteriota bacterium]REK15234.1 MAG: HlyC/CorC family transporter [Acidobacteriota bacterium]REK46324.1 MAG: HlyC/CorC family transporter [Acidobacteriota bacterium]